jgi:hypothetical protein
VRRGRRGRSPRRGRRCQRAISRASTTKSLTRVRRTLTSGSGPRISHLGSGADRQAGEPPAPDSLAAVQGAFPRSALACWASTIPVPASTAWRVSRAQTGRGLLQESSCATPPSPAGGERNTVTALWHAILNAEKSGHERRPRRRDSTSRLLTRTSLAFQDRRHLQGVEHRTVCPTLLLNRNDRVNHDG